MAFLSKFTRRHPRNTMNMRFRLNVPLKRPSPKLVNLLRCGPVPPRLFSQGGDGGRKSAERPDLTLLSFNIMIFETFAPTLGRSVYDLSNQQKYVVSCLWFDVGKILFNNLPFVFEVVFLNPQSSKTDSGSQPSSRNAEGQLL